ncbi:MAG: hypothetical protein QM708_05520 [Propioniciclava sp.]|uniref:hypothetical protein n=1 Tax=Propioniciclava sp. TaxID=2038686 RepID=UPI0039E620A6
MLQLFGTAVGEVLVISLLVGAGLPALFAFGMRAYAYGEGGAAVVDGGPHHLIGKVVGIACFVLVVAIILLGLAVIVSSGFGYHVSFDGVLPAFTKK